MFLPLQNKHLALLALLAVSSCAELSDEDVTDEEPVVESAESALTGCVPGYGWVALFSESAYGGECVLLPQGKFGRAWPGNGTRTFLPNDTVSSIRVGEGVLVRICEHADFHGACRTSTGHLKYLDKFDNFISSLEVMGVGVLTITSQETVPSGAVMLEPNVNYTDSFDLANGDTLVSLGDYPTLGSAGIPDNSLDRVTLGRSVALWVCTEVNFQGTCHLIRKPSMDLASLIIGRDSVSSLRVIPRN